MNTKYWTAFASIEQLDSSFIQRLYNYFGDVETAFNATLQDLKQIEGLSVRKAENFLEKRKGVNPEQTLDFVLNKGIKILTYEDSRYPYMLRQISNPPMTLFYKGDLFSCNLDRTVFQHHHVMGLDVPVDNATAMGMLQRLCDLNGKMQRLFPVQHAFFLHVLLQGNTVDQFHDDIICADRGRHVVY